MHETYYVYMMSNKTCTVLYVGTTRDIRRRVAEHKSGEIDGFSKTYHVNRLVYLEECQSCMDAFRREKQLKHWKREKKDELIASVNPHWRDLSEE